MSRFVPRCASRFGRPLSPAVPYSSPFGRLLFDDAYTPATNVLVTRLPDVIDELGRSVAQWRVESRGFHRAVGVVPSTGNRKGSTVTNTFYHMPWSMTVRAVP